MEPSPRGGGDLVSSSEAVCAPSSPRASGDDGSVVGPFGVSLALALRSGETTTGLPFGRWRRRWRAQHVRLETSFRPEIRRDYPLNLSILLSGGKETNKDSPSNGE